MTTNNQTTSSRVKDIIVKELERQWHIYHDALKYHIDIGDNINNEIDELPHFCDGIEKAIMVVKAMKIDEE